MRYAALSDLHLGFRGVGRTVGGRNQREIDVENAWYAAVNMIIDREPQIVFIGGDCFHSVRPSFHAVKAFMEGLDRFSANAIEVVIVNGNHESPRTAETLSPNIVGESAAKIFDQPGRYRVLPGVSVVGLPFVALAGESVYKVEPDPTADVNVLLIHAAVRASARPGALPTMYGGPAAYDVSRADGFDLVVCGDFHEFTLLGEEPFAFYPGSIERTSSDIWKEQAPKGFVVGDTAAGTFEFVEIPTRVMSEVVLNGAEPADAMTVNTLLNKLLIDPARDELLRVKVEAYSGSKDEIDWQAVASLKERHVHFLLDLRMAESEAREFGDRRERQGRTLAQEAADFLAGDEEAVRERCLQLLGVVE